LAIAAEKDGSAGSDRKDGTGATSDKLLAMGQFIRDAVLDYQGEQ